ncbi:alpha/beta hydrolase [Emticicia sp. BO119]|uniref:alpha/beta hydrolase n=1 Tax=Emticicia sp. BO119 TaxID=2757768 RepID=UPI0015F040FC|nr:alpha/beta hydrolase [Emticicia sp. BO119]MBA4852264.1 alpha/beta hydrolase [Emticicia sp. BO119]
MKKLFLMLFAMTLMSDLFAQNETILLYTGTAPGSTGKQVPEDAKTTDGITRVRDVTQPALIVYPAKKKTSDATVIICPGGGYSILAIDHEGHDIAKWFNAHGMTAFVLKYRLPQEDLFDNDEIRPLQDAQQAIRLIRKNAAKYGVAPDKIGIMGFSAGGHLASTASTHFNTQVGEITDPSVSVRPDFSLLIYPVISFNDRIGHLGSRDNLIGKNPPVDKIELYSNDKQVTKDTPPTFLVSTTDDWVQPENSIAYFLACKKNKVPVEMHIYEKGGHGYGLKKQNRGPVETWAFRLEDWLKDRKLMK